MAKKKLVPHENLLYDVILRQAGSLSKATLEGVMNSVDAGAKRIDIELNSHSVVIVDDGRGFRSEKEIDEWFAQFGTPHEVDEDDNSTDARFGRFRMGRGQLFAFGQNTWVTNEFRMEVDIKREGLDFEVYTDPKSLHDGCHVSVTLYTPLDAHDLMNTEKEIIKFCKYIDVDLYLNGTKINEDPKDLQWDYETEDGWIKVISSGEGGVNTYNRGKGVDVYQQGVYVETISHWDVGVGGVLVSKEPLKLNFARNQVMRSTCPRWKRMYKLLKETGQNEVKKKTNLDAAERAAMTAQLRSNGMNFHDATSMRLFLDVQGKTWSSNQIANAYSSKGKFHLTPAHRLVISFAPLNDRKADHLMQTSQALVFDEQLLKEWECAPEDFIEEVLKQFQWSHHSRIVYRPIHEIDDRDDGEYYLLDEKELTPRQKQVKQILQGCGYHLQWLFWRYNEERIVSKQRTIRFGKSPHARAWTDGETYIAFNIEEITKRLNTMTPGKWAELALLMLHEYCHASPNTEAHTHDPHFYKLYHDLSDEMPELGEKMHRTYLRMLARASKNGKIPQKLQLQVLKETERIQRELAMNVMEEVDTGQAKKKTAKKKAVKK